MKTLNMLENQLSFKKFCNVLKSCLVYIEGSTNHCTWVCMYAKFFLLYEKNLKAVHHQYNMVHTMTFIHNKYLSFSELSNTLSYILKIRTNKASLNLLLKSNFLQIKKKEQQQRKNQ